MPNRRTVCAALAVVLILSALLAQDLPGTGYGVALASMVRPQPGDPDLWVYELPPCLRGCSPRGPTIEAGDGASEKVLWYELLLCLRGYGASCRPLATRPKNPDPPLPHWPQPWVKIDWPPAPSCHVAPSHALRFTPDALRFTPSA